MLRINRPLCYAHDSENGLVPESYVTRLSDVFTRCKSCGRSEHVPVNELRYLPVYSRRDLMTTEMGSNCLVDYPSTDPETYVKSNALVDCPVYRP